MFATLDINPCDYEGKYLDIVKYFVKTTIFGNNSQNITDSLLKFRNRIFVALKCKRNYFFFLTFFEINDRFIHTWLFNHKKRTRKKFLRYIAVYNDID